jgi:PHD/YefM family antitoxin component YafN of YafNO toxin-antitoxin module
VLNKVRIVNTVPAQDIKRRGISAVDEALEKGPVHVIRNNQPQYVVLKEERYQELLDAQQEAYVARLKASLEDARAGRSQRFDSARNLLNAIDSAEGQ